MEYFDNGVFKRNYIFKSKIKEKIKDLENQLEITADLFAGSVLHCQINLLKELLGEEK